MAKRSKDKTGPVKELETYDYHDGPPDEPEIEAAPVAPPAAPVAPAKPLGLAINVRQFAIATGHRLRSAGFEHYANKTYGKSHRLPVAEWTLIWDAWWLLPAGQPKGKV